MAPLAAIAGDAGDAPDACLAGTRLVVAGAVLDISFSPLISFAVTQQLEIASRRQQMLAPPHESALTGCQAVTRWTCNRLNRVARGSDAGANLWAVSRGLRHQRLHGLGIDLTGIRVRTDRRTRRRHCARARQHRRRRQRPGLGQPQPVRRAEVDQLPARLLPRARSRSAAPAKSLAEVKVPRLMTSRWMRANQFSTG